MSSSEDRKSKSLRVFRSENLNPRMLALVSLLVIVPFAMFSVGAVAAEPNRLTVSQVPGEFVVGDPGASGTLVIDVFVSGDAAAEIVVEFIDFYEDENGESVTLPGGSTPYSLANALSVEEFDNVYEPNETGSRFEIVLKPKTKKLNAIFQGGLKIVMNPISRGGGTSGLSSSGSIVSMLTVSPFGFAGSKADGQIVAAQITKHTLTPLTRSSFIDSLIPDIPGVVNYGPVESKVTYENKGSYPTFTSISWDFSHNEQSLATQFIPAKLLIAGSSETKAITTEIANKVGTGNLNVLPTLGFVNNKIIVQSSLGGTKFEPYVMDQTFLVLQWKEPFVVLVLLALLIRWALRKNLSAKQKENTQSLLYLAIKSGIRKLKKTAIGSRSKSSSSTTKPLETTILHSEVSK